MNQFIYLFHNLMLSNRFCATRWVEDESVTEKDLRPS